MRHEKKYETKLDEDIISFNEHVIFNVPSNAYDYIAFTENELLFTIYTQLTFINMILLYDEG